MPRPLPPPPESPDSAAFYAAAAEGRFLVPLCARCGRRHWYPRPACPYCSGDARLEEASGRGRVHSFTIVRRAEPAHVVAYVALEEGPAMLTHVVDCDFGEVVIGLPVEVVFKPTLGGPPAPCFRPRRT